MLTTGERPFATVATVDQWVRAVHERTTIVDGCVQLAPRAAADAGAAVGGAARRGGLAFDRVCRLLRSDPATGGIERWQWAADQFGVPRSSLLARVALDATASAPVIGDFASPSTTRSELDLGPLVVTADGLVQAVDRRANAVLTVDLVAGRVLRRASTSTTDVLPPLVDLATDGTTVWLLGGPPPVLLRSGGGADPAPVDPFPALAAAPAGTVAVAVDVLADGRPVLLVRLPDGSPRVAIAGRTTFLTPGTTGATDVAVDGSGAIVVAGLAGEPFVRLASEDGRFAGAGALDAAGYDGSGIAVDPDGRVVFWTPRGLRVAFLTRPRLEIDGRVTTYRLDSGVAATRWGRCFVEACVPEGASLRIHTVSAEEQLDPSIAVPALAWTPPADVDVAGIDVTATPPQVARADDAWMLQSEGRPLHRRSNGREIAWAPLPSGDPFEVYEAPATGAPGRFLWIRLELRGTGRTTPRVRALRIERPGHRLVEHFPRAWSRDARAADFLTRYLAPLDGELARWGAHTAASNRLVDPRVAPDDTLEWLASFVGLTVDGRIEPARRRRLIAEASALFARRGTVAGLARMLELCLGFPVVIIERFRVRGLGGALLDDVPSDPATWPVVGAGMRVGGSGGDDPSTPSPDAFGTHAHRFSVLVRGTLGSEQHTLVRDLLDVHRPAHTVVDVCTVDRGSRVGVGLHIGLSAVIGSSGGFEPIVVGDAVLGRDQTIGVASVGRASRSGPGGPGGGGVAVAEVQVRRAHVALGGSAPHAELERLDRLSRERLATVLDRGVATALAAAAIGPDELVVLRRVDVPLRLRATSTAGDLEAAWLEAMVRSLRRAFESVDAVRYRSPAHALAELVAEAAAGDLSLAWAWTALGLWPKLAERPVLDPAAGIAFALEHLPELAPAVLLAASRDRAHWDRLVDALDDRRWVALACAIVAAAHRDPRVVDDVVRRFTPRAAGDGPSLGPRAVSARTAEPSSREPRRGRRAASAAIGCILAVAGADGAPVASTDAFLAAAIRVATRIERYAPPRPTRRADRVVVDGAPAPGDVAEHGAGPTGAEAAGQSGHATQYAGLLVLLHLVPALTLMAEPGVPPPDGLRWLLHRVALELAPIGPRDPAALAFAGLGPEAAPPEGPPATDDPLVAEVADALVDLLLARLDDPEHPHGLDREGLVAAVAARPGVVTADPGWIDVWLPLDAVWMPVRRAGLDVDPGWLPWLGTVVRFAYG